MSFADSFLCMIGYNIYNIDGGQIEMKALKIIKTKARDNSRVPMHWDDSQYAGFSGCKAMADAN